jgi:hypothetical protein
MSKFLSGKPTYANVVATVALVVAMGGGAAYAATSLPKHSVGTRQIKGKAVTASKLANRAMVRRKVANGAIGTKQLANGSVTLADLAGADVSRVFDLPSIPPNTCFASDLTVPGARVGQFPILSFIGNVPLPSAIVALAVKVDATGSVRAKFCNVTDTATTAATNIGIRVITLN